MQGIYHRQVLQRAVGGHVSPRALSAITEANLGQDGWMGLVAHPEYHFDDSLFSESLRYIEDSRALAALAESPAQAWAAFGRLSHAAQDFYSHSNYVALWLECFASRPPPPPEAINGLDPALLNHPRLISGRVYWPVEALWIVPALRPLVNSVLPKDSHACMNLDGPGAGPLFPYSLEAAVQRTVAEFKRTLAAIGERRGQAAVMAFRDVGL